MTNRKVKLSEFSQNKPPYKHHPGQIMTTTLGAPHVFSYYQSSYPFHKGNCSGTAFLTIVLCLFNGLSLSFVCMICVIIPKDIPYSLSIQ